MAPVTGALPAALPVADPLLRSPPQPAVRPAAPAIHFAPRPEPAPEVDAVTCPHCGNQNQSTVRFCVACGKGLAAPAAPAPAAPAPRPRGPAIDLTKTVPSPPPEHDPTPAPAAVAAARVVDLGAPAVAPARQCPRCRAPSDGAAQFCRLCGAPLGTVAEGPVARVAPASPPTRVPAPPPAAKRPATSTVAMTGPAAAPVAVTAIPRASIVLVARDGGEGPAYPLGETTDIGRTEGAILLADDSYISPRHARIALRGRAYFLRDLGSTNGVYVRIPFGRGPGPGPRPREPGADPSAHEPPEPMPEAMVEQTIKDQDLFLVGQQVLRFEVVKDADEGFGVASDNGTLLFGSPASPRHARLSQRTVEGVTRDVFNIRKTETVLGRESGDIVFTDDPFLSRRHAILRVHLTAPAPSASSPRAPDAKGQDRRFSLTDLGSSNGTFLRVHEEVRLRHGDQFRIGQQLFRFDLDAANNGA